VTAGHDAFVGLGSNLAGPADQVIAGADALAAIADTRLVARSPLYGSAPMGPADQPDYVNAVAWLRTDLAPHALLEELQRIEATTGRDRSGERWGPRTLDLDLLLYDDVRCRDQRLTLPHPGIAERAFVLVPLADIGPDVTLPGYNEPVGRLATRIDRGGLWPLEAIA
jgi:2-amino-4-hydroxy-6-hydroxymethyldihydropteridine diphosphokinase